MLPVLQRPPRVCQLRARIRDRTVGAPQRKAAAPTHISHSGTAATAVTNTTCVPQATRWAAPIQQQWFTQLSATGTASQMKPMVPAGRNLPSYLSQGTLILRRLCAAVGCSCKACLRVTDRGAGLPWGRLATLKPCTDHHAMVTLAWLYSTTPRSLALPALRHEQRSERRGVQHQQVSQQRHAHQPRWQGRADVCDDVCAAHDA